MKTNPYIQSFCFALVGVFFLCFTPTGTAQTEELTSFQHPDANVDLATAKATVKAYEEGDWEKLRTNLKEDAVIYGLGSFDSLNVEETISYWTEGREIAIPSLAKNGTWLGISLPEGPQNGKWIFHWGTNTLKYSNGEEISFPFHVAIKMEDEKVAEAHFYYDNSRIIRGMGFAISPPIPEESQELVIDGIE